MKNYTILFLAISIVFFSCEKVFLEPKPKTDPESIVLEYFKLVEEKYSMLEFKNVNVSHLRDSLMPIVKNNPDENTAMLACQVLASKLRDGHSPFLGYINGALNGFEFDVYEGYPPAFNKTLVMDNYITPSGMKEITKNDSTAVYYGRLTQNTEIGYIYVPSWSIELDDNDYKEIFEFLADTKGIIFDQRGNGGGSPETSIIFASHFYNERMYTGYEKFKSGPGANDFVTSESYVNPAAKSYSYHKPVCILVDRGVYSASTTFCYTMAPLSRVKLVGQRTGGGSGNFIDGYLANGWKWQLSTSEFIDHLGRRLDDGLDPDIQQDLDPSNPNIDEIIVRAIQELD